MKKTINKYLYQVLLLLVAIIWGSGFIAAKHAINLGASPEFILTLRFLIAAIFIWIVFRRHLKDISRSEIFGGGITGVLLYFAFAFQTFGIQYTTPSKNAFITAISVVIVPFILWMIYKKRPSNKTFYSALICIFGIGLLTLNSDLSVNKGDMLTLVCAVLFAGHIVSNGVFSKKIHPLKLTFIQIFFAFLLSLFSMIITGVESVSVGFSKEAIMAILYLGVFSTGVSFLLQTVAQNKVNASKTAVLLSLEAVFGTMFSILLMGEILSFKLVLGCIFVFSAILINELEIDHKNFKKLTKIW